MVVIRLARGGAKKRPHYRIVVADSRNPRDGRYIEKLGYFNPIAQGPEIRLQIERERLQEWVNKGAKLSERLGTLVKEWDKQAS